MLEIGTGSGYLTACLARLGQQVTSYRYPRGLSLPLPAKTRRHSQISNVTLMTADAASWYDSEKRYRRDCRDRLHTGTAATVHRNLAIGGRLFVITGELPIMEASLITRIEREPLVAAKACWRPAFRRS